MALTFSSTGRIPLADIKWPQVLDFWDHEGALLVFETDPPADSSLSRTATKLRR